MQNWGSRGLIGWALGCSLSLVQPASADVKEVRLGVKGATCATCAFALRKAFKHLNGVADAQLTTKLAVMQVRMKPGLWPDLPQMKRTIHEAGFESKTGEVDLVVTGTLRREGDQLLMEVAGMKGPLLVPIEPAEAGAAVDAQLNHLVELKAKWKPDESTPSGTGILSVVSLQPQK